MTDDAFDGGRRNGGAADDAIDGAADDAIDGAADDAIDGRRRPVTDIDP
ncbi:MAG: hypothetical protein JF597_38485 [Streptomyces sp.]|jgi:hypothetical protein|nr:hypothetical protein [Streptomyces sp.]MBW8799249.1 hypothetical protein [Streptomyces sp.]